jgi:uncharacterized membrane protein YgcG
MRGLLCLTILVTVLALPCPTAAQTSAPAALEPTGGDLLPPDEILRLVAPIALYPDVLIAQILPAATFPTDVVMAARWLRTKPDLGQLEKKPWDASVQALCRYPEVLDKLDQDLDWTNALGAAFLAQGEDVMKAIQSARETAQARGVLQTNPQQTVVVEQEAIRIVPTQATVIYVPQYSPQIIYVEDDDDHVSTGAAATAAAVSFGAGLALGAWLDMDCGWHGYSVHYCKPGYWGGYAHRGAIAVGDDWVAGVGPRRAFAAGEDRGFYAGPRGAAVWGENGGAAWRRPPGAAPRPAYTGRYAAYGNRNAYNRSGNFSNNQVNVNRNNVNIDRGDRTNIAGGSRTNVGGGDRTNLGRDAGQRPARPSGGSAQQLPANAFNRPAGQPSAFDTRSTRPQTRESDQRGQQSRGSNASRPSASPSQAMPDRSASPSRSSAFGDNRSSQQVSQSSNRGSSSRSAASSRGGGRSRGGGGRGGRR